jgi:ubiquinone/menaquinone biosynthesis C-methylase UbiE
MSAARRRQLADDLVALTPQQPAVVFWRAIELDHLLAQPLPEDGRGIDVGCGDGRLMQVLRRHGVDWRLVGVDYDEAEIALAEATGVYEELHACSAESIPELDASFDFAFSNSVLEHIPPLPAVLRETARVLKPGGRLLATVPADTLHDCLAGPGTLAPLLGRDRSTYLDRLDDRTAHVNLWSRERWTSELRDAGFGEVSFSPYLTAADVRRWERLSNWTGGVVYALAGGKKRPIEISRTAGVATGSRVANALRGPGRAIVRRALSRREREPSANGSGATACLLIDATRSES